MHNASLSGESLSDIPVNVQLYSQARKPRKTAVRGWTAVSVLVGLSLAGYLGAFVVIDTYLKGPVF